jgi:DNA-binding NarL/FixJ family response regulator
MRLDFLDGECRGRSQAHQPVGGAGFAELLNTQPDFAVIATASDGAEAVQLCAELHPDVVLMDVRMPGMDGIEATRQIAHASQAHRSGSCDQP